MRLVQIGPYNQLLSHFRYLLTLRSKEGRYHSLILFRLSPSGSSEISRQTSRLGKLSIGKNNDIQSSSVSDSSHRQLYAMESTCPHLGADMSHADIEECEETMVAVCPWHRYDFDLLTGESETGLKACTYTVEVETDPLDGTEKVSVEAPEGGTEWSIIELRPVSEEFADPPMPRTGLANSNRREMVKPEQEVVPEENPPTTLMQWAVLILNTFDPKLKVERTRHAVQAFRKGQLQSIGNKMSSAPSPPDVPPREHAFLQNTVSPTKVKNRRNKAAMLHALANIEQWAIDLAWDIMARFGPTHPDLPPAFFSDFSKMALDESKHFSLLVSRLAAISPSTPYGTLPVHASLWESATATAHSLRARLCIIHLVHEARGLDVNPATIERFRKAGDQESVAALEIIHADEVTHVSTGHRWLTWLCEKEGVDPVAAFRQEVRTHWKGEVKGPFNTAARDKAGITREFYEDLRGQIESPRLAAQRDERGESSLEITYENKDG